MGRMAPPLLLLQDIHLALGSQPLLAGAEIGVGAGERICLVGRNGSGKSTLLKLAAGLIQQDSGTRFLQPGTSVRYLPQEPDLSGHKSVMDYVFSGLGPTGDENRARTLIGQLGLDPNAAPRHLSGGESRRATLRLALIAYQPPVSGSSLSAALCLRLGSGRSTGRQAPTSSSCTSRVCSERSTCRVHTGTHCCSRCCSGR